MAKYRKKPVVIEAVQLTKDLLGSVPQYSLVLPKVFAQSGYAVIDTLEGQMRAEIGDWIIIGVKGEVYPCKPDIFEATYEPVKPKPPRRGSK